MENWAFVRGNYYGFDYTFENHVTITSRDESDVFAGGPSVNFERDFPISAPFSISASGTISLLVGGYWTTNAFHDVDDAYELWQNADTVLHFPYYYDGWVNYTNAQLTMIPAAEVEIGFLYKLGEKINAGLGFWGKSLLNYPLVTRLYAPWDIGNWVTAPSGLNFKLDRQNVYICGILLKIQYDL